jgi:phage repressor protein C with HTH and peptisase S24 domain
MGLTQDDLADRMGTSTQQISRLERGERKLDTKWMAKFAYALGVKEAEVWLAPEDDAPATARFASDALPLPINDLTRTVPIMGSAQAGPNGAFDLNWQGGPIDYAPRPPGIVEGAKVFAIYVEGDSMVPWRRPGELVYLHETKPPAPDCHVVAVVEADRQGDPPKAYLKHLLRRSQTKIEMEQYNPKQPFVLDAAKVSKLYRVLETSEILGY